MSTASLSRIRSIMENSFLFRGWPGRELARLAEASHFRAVAHGDILFERGDPCASLWMLLDGRVQMFRLGEDGLETVLHAVQAPGLVGCAALFLGKSFPASSRVVSSSAQFIQVDGATLIDLLKRRPELAFRMIGGLARRLSELADRIENLRGASSTGRLARWLLSRVPANAGDAVAIPLPGPKKALAAELDMTAETLSRCLKRLADQGILRVERRVLHVLSIDRLHAVESE